MKEKNNIDIGIMKGFFAMILGLGLVFGFGPAARTATPSLQPETSSGFQFVADAYGTQATLGNVVVAGKTASARHPGDAGSVGAGTQALRRSSG